LAWAATSSVPSPGPQRNAEPTHERDAGARSSSENAQQARFCTRIAARALQPAPSEGTVSIILFLLFGLVIGALARFIVPGKEPGGWVVSMLLGVAGSLLGALVGRALGIYRQGEQTGGFFMSLLGAIVLVAIYHAIARRRATHV
jgi:uncharacterized membrane protein YeaQ/YmgE (transglycosylase-associated protein family)